jgi:hypothetical protein
MTLFRHRLAPESGRRFESSTARVALTTKGFPSSLVEVVEVEVLGLSSLFPAVLRRRHEPSLAVQ